MMADLFRRIRAAWHPAEYHGWGIHRRYFEGWYFKVVSPDERHAFAFIPGISMGRQGEPHAFVQVMDGKACQGHYFRFQGDDFQPAADRFEVEVGENFFSAEEIRLRLPGFGGEIQTSGRVQWPKMLGAPGIMGWYSFVPFMECNHGVVSMSHRLHGHLTYTPAGAHSPQHISFEGGKGYIEKDWGRSFPRAYVWMQTNHFPSAERASLMASVAHIPWLSGHFIGSICGMWLEGRLYRFATYTGAKHHLELGEHSATLIFRHRREELRLHAVQAASTPLVSPLHGEMAGKINESLQAQVGVQLLLDGHLVFEDTGRHAGLELAGDLPVLMA